MFDISTYESTSSPGRLWRRLRRVNFQLELAVASRMLAVLSQSRSRYFQEVEHILARWHKDTERMTI